MTNNNIKPTKPVDHSMYAASLRWAEAAHFDDLAAQAERWGNFRMAIRHKETAAELRRLARGAGTPTA